MFKKMLLVTLILVLVAGQAFAALKVLPEETANELQQIAKNSIAVDLKVDMNTIEVQEAWVQELFNLGIDLYHVYVMVGSDNKASVIINVDTKEILTQEEYTELMEEDRANEPAEPVFRTMALDPNETVSADDKASPGTPGTDTEDLARTTSIELAPTTDEKSSTNWLIPGLAVLALGGLGLTIKKNRK